MIYTIKEYAKKFSFGGKFVCTRAIRNRLLKGQLPSNHIPKKLDFGHGIWIIEVIEKL